MQRFVVLGSNSFSGASFCDAVLRDDPANQVVGISRSPEPHPVFLPYRDAPGDRFRFYQLDLNRDLDAVLARIRSEEPECIVNFAAQGMVGESWQSPLDWFRTNTLALAGLADGLREAPFLKRFVQISTPEIYGTCRERVTESAPWSPSSPYAASKAAGELALGPYFKEFGLPLVTTRASNVYGPHQQLYRIIPRTALRVLAGRRVALHGGGEARRSYIHIRDVCRATLAIARGGRLGEVYHIAPGGRGIRIADLVARVCERLGRRFEDCVEVVGERTGQDGAYELDAGKLRRELGWEPAISLETGLDESVQWVEKNFETLQELPHDYQHHA
ncbi:MAG: GDP-mannose 4,6-dehydratase [Proteobacteria bacterium]|nr:GDP-mannose 4,6-dehydratase [Pseudomonadota bacterium]